MNKIELYNKLRKLGFSERIVNAMEKIDRIDFVSEDMKNYAYYDVPLPIGHGQTISQPYTVAFMLDKLEIKPGMKILDVGSGSGWTTALLANIVGERGEVIGVEILDELVNIGQKNLKKYNLKNAKIIPAQKGTYGFPTEGPYDRILVSAAASKKIPTDLMKQLRTKGILVSAVDTRIEKYTDMKKEAWEGFSFVPLKEVN
ncbi:MAG: protein-L-isoaspartate O-methyltransferase [Nanoarchaeota archaeon]